MYFSKENNFFHGIMFHHFHDEKVHKKSQGSIDRDEFYQMIKFIGRENILNSDEFLNRYKENSLKEKDVCFTFDDGSKSQYDVALPVLEDLKIKSFFFTYTSFLGEGKPDLLEVYRYFRSNYFSNIEEFYHLFFEQVDSNLNNFLAQIKKILKSKKTNSLFILI